jgi:hypothetical protein
MRNLFNRVKNFGAAAVIRTKSAVSNKRGEGFVDTAVKILIAVVIGALVLAGLYLLFNSTVMPTVTQKVQDLFNYTP